MIGLITAITIVSLVIPVYVYLGYPLMLFLVLKSTKGKDVDKSSITPTVSMIVSCYNEQEIIEHKIRNCIAIDYPDNKLDFIFVSDGSEDRTDSIIREFSNEHIKLIRQEGRLGKTMGINLAISQARGEIVVFSDANAMYQKEAIRMLVRNFNDLKVGYVVGAALYRDDTESFSGVSENSYWEYEIFLKKIESKLHSVVGGDGAIYAIRKQLYRRLDQEDINDFVNPLQIISKGFRGVFEEEAVCYEQTAGSFEKEAKRKQRIVNRSFTGLLKNKTVLNPFKFGFFSLQLLSHKLLRWLVPFFIIIAILGIFVLAQVKIFAFQILLLLGIVFAWSVMLGGLLKGGSNVPSILLYPYYFYLVNINSLRGVLQSLSGKVEVTWSTARQNDDTRTSDRFWLISGYVFLFLASIIIFTSTLISVIQIL